MRISVQQMKDGDGRPLSELLDELGVEPMGNDKTHQDDGNLAVSSKTSAKTIEELAKTSQISPDNCNMGNENRTPCSRVWPTPRYIGRE